MRYKLIIQALRESSDNNVLAFVKDVEKIKRLTAEERQYYLTNCSHRISISPYLKDNSIINLLTTGILFIH